MAKYKHKPTEVEAVQWFKHGDHPAVLQYRFPHGAMGQQVIIGCSQCGRGYEDHGQIGTLEGPHIVCPGDWIVKGTKGEYWAVKPDIFENTYEAVSTSFPMPMLSLCGCEKSRMLPSGGASWVFDYDNPTSTYIECSYCGRKSATIHTPFTLKKVQKLADKWNTDGAKVVDVEGLWPRPFH